MKKEKKWQMEKFTKIGDIRGVIYTITKEVAYVKTDDDGNAIYREVPLNSLPTLTFTGTVKTHGTNAGIGLTTEGEVYAMSRNNIITPLGDNAGFATWVEAEKVYLKDILLAAQTLARSFHKDSKVYIYGEWIGKGVQNRVGISTLPKQWTY